MTTEKYNPIFGDVVDLSEEYHEEFDTRIRAHPVHTFQVLNKFLNSRGFMLSIARLEESKSSDAE